jgi:hypothetical protein
VSYERHFLFSGEGLAYLQEHYIKDEKSTYKIAEDLKVYANVVRRALKYHGLQRRTKSDAQKVAIKTGRHTRRKRTDG